MSAIFISYRREDMAGNAGRIYDRLVDRFGPERVYRDVDSGQPGEDFVETIRNTVKGSDVLLALIGPNWLKTTDKSGGWRLASEDDLVRVEIATAPERGIRIIPVLLHGAKMPGAGNLPSTQTQLMANRNSVATNDVVVYFVRSTNPSFNGCAAHPANRPSAVVASIASEWTLGHEVGHVLGLGHVTPTDRLMMGGGTNNITNPPPDFVAGEVQTMDNSPFTQNLG
jgi:hypothetical protein